MHEASAKWKEQHFLWHVGLTRGPAMPRLCISQTRGSKVSLVWSEGRGCWHEAVRQYLCSAFTWFPHYFVARLASILVVLSKPMLCRASSAARWLSGHCLPAATLPRTCRACLPSSVPAIGRSTMLRSSGESRLHHSSQHSGAVWRKLCW